MSGVGWGSFVLKETEEASSISIEIASSTECWSLNLIG